MKTVRQKYMMDIGCMWHIVEEIQCKIFDYFCLISLPLIIYLTSKWTGGENIWRFFTVFRNSMNFHDQAPASTGPNDHNSFREYCKGDSPFFARLRIAILNENFALEWIVIRPGMPLFHYVIQPSALGVSGEKLLK